MAYSKTGWATVSAAKRGNTISVYTYSTADTIADVNTTGYFNDLSDTLEVNDLIIVGHSTGVSFTYVASNAAGVVDVVDGLAIPTTDTD